MIDKLELADVVMSELFRQMAMAYDQANPCSAEGERCFEDHSVSDLEGWIRGWVAARCGVEAEGGGG